MRPLQLRVSPAGARAFDFGANYAVFAPATPRLSVLSHTNHWQLQGAACGCFLRASLAPYIRMTMAQLASGSS